MCVFQVFFKLSTSATKSRKVSHLFQRGIVIVITHGIEQFTSSNIQIRPNQLAEKARFSTEWTTQTNTLINKYHREMLLDIALFLIIFLYFIKKLPGFLMVILNIHRLYWGSHGWKHNRNESIFRVFQATLRSGVKKSDILLGGFFTGWWEPEEWFWTFEPKATNNFL